MIFVPTSFDKYDIYICSISMRVSAPTYFDVSAIIADIMNNIFLKIKKKKHFIL